MSAGTCNPDKRLTFLCAISQFLPFPSSTPASRRALSLSRDMLFFIYLCPQVFNHTSITKQTNKFRPYAPDTNIDMSYESQRSRERLWTLIHNICSRQDWSNPVPQLASVALSNVLTCLMSKERLKEWNP